MATMVANFRPQKDHPNVIARLAQTLTTIPEGKTQPRLLLAGAPQQSYTAVHQLVSNLGLLDTVNFLGQVRDVSGLLLPAILGVLTSTHEGLSNAVIEYMASGLPVVATDLPGNLEALGYDPEQPLCKPGDLDSLAAKLPVLLYNTNLRQKLGTRNRQRASEEFSIDAMCEKSVA